MINLGILYHISNFKSVLLLYIRILNVVDFIHEHRKGSGEYLTVTVKRLIDHQLLTIFGMAGNAQDPVKIHIPGAVQLPLEVLDYIALFK